MAGVVDGMVEAGYDVVHGRWGRTGVWVSTGAIDPASSPAAALRGRVVTLDAGATVLEDGVVYARDGSIADVLPASTGPPAGFEGVAVTRTLGTLFPGLIELHNHMPYDILSLWTVPRRFTNRDQWGGRSTPQYHQFISGPMGVLASPAGRNDDLPGHCVGVEPWHREPLPGAGAQR